MTVVLECVALAGLGAATYQHSTGKQAKERKTALDLYARYFSNVSDLEQQDSGEATALASSLPAGLHSCAKSSIETIERYQRERRGKWFWETETDVKTQILEELKRWLLTLSDSSVRVPDVSNRLDYCFQFLLRPSAFSKDFLTTMAQVCNQLERLLRHAISSQHTGAERIDNVLAQGRHLTELVMSVLLFALADEQAVPGRSLSFASLLAHGELESEAGGPTGGRTDVGRMIQAFLRTDHLRDLCSAEPAPAGMALQQLLKETRARWEEDTVAAASGLRESFRNVGHRSTRLACLDLCDHFDRVVFFLVKLRPYHNLAGTSGDMALFWLRDSFGHLLSELEWGLLQLHQSRLEVMRAAKLHLQELGKHRPAANTEGFRWMQGLRHVDEPAMDCLHKELVTLCTNLRVASTTTREAELREVARDELRALASSFDSVEFQARCMPELRSCVVRDVQQLAAMASVQEGVTGGPPQLTDTY